MLKTLMVVLLLGLPIHTQAQSSDDQGDSGCGPSKGGWDAKTVKQQPWAPHPPDGKALVVQTMMDGSVIGGNKATTRVGVDGAWVGANHGDSYFTLLVDPFHHSICTDWQSILYTRSGLASVADLDAQGGEIYYFRLSVRDVTNYRSGDVGIEWIGKSEARLLMRKSEYATSPRRSDLHRRKAGAADLE